ncbi:TetR/AcrR family transcriptional regulator [Paenibacillus sp. NPDC056579]|uniref:TetR/AcrR family transcriptional regulator n=1 Tax=unclassified Paenibacillus TaxID=185978 RepID=UPI001EF8CF9F|nr:TetR/AcrR family transcriptional regulator [Paenibacillus sp. H1-7]ULL17690.1 TetR/AcrR family transcriptional regulator [Paenibacillus sp. H1-7]
MSAERIKQAAILKFTENGYEGTSLSEIAEEVGIKKQSVYCHFKNKDDLVLTINQEIIQDDVDFLTRYFERMKDSPLEEVLHTLIDEYREKYLNDKKYKFMFLMSFIPPKHLEVYFLNSYNIHLLHLKTLLTAAFAKAPNIAVTTEEGITAFTTMFDGLMTQLVYETPKSFDKAFELSWKVYWRGISV